MEKKALRRSRLHAAHPFGTTSLAHRALRRIITTFTLLYHPTALAFWTLTLLFWHFPQNFAVSRCSICSSNLTLFHHHRYFAYPFLLIPPPPPSLASYSFNSGTHLGA